MEAKKFIKKAIEKHGNLYDYSLIENTKNVKNIYKIVCLKHGIFKQRGDSHLRGAGCGKCKKSILKTKKEFILEANIKYNNKYDYSLINYVNSKIKIDIICPEHGIFKQTPDNHLSGHECSKCKGKINQTKMKNIVGDSFIDKANKIHNNKYLYTNSIYINAKEKVIILCPIHGNFKQTPNDHLSGKGCPKCGINLSIGENEVNSFIINELELFTEKIRIENKEIDIYIPSHKLGIEYNGLYYHSTKFKANNYHLNKTILCNKNNIDLIQIFEDEWLHKKEIVKSIIKRKLNIINCSILSENCTIKKVSVNDSVLFLNRNHMEGFIDGEYKIGLFHNNELISLIILNKSKKINGSYDILRFCDKLNTGIIGGASKLLNYFIKRYNPISILSYVDRRYDNSGLYKGLGFTIFSNIMPRYFYFKQHELIRYDKNIGNSSFFKIYDCGIINYILKIPQS